MADKPEWYLKKNPFGIVPTLETPAGELIYESPMIVNSWMKVTLKSSCFLLLLLLKQRMMLEYFSKVGHMETCT